MNQNTADLPSEPAVAPPNGFDPEPFRASLKAYLQRRGARDEADDLVQETFLRSLQRPPSGAPQPWLYRIAGNLLTDRRRSQSRAASALPHLVPSEADAVHGAAASIDREDLARAGDAIAVLPDQQRRALQLRLLDSLDYDAIGARLACSSATARQHFYLAMKALRAALAETEDDHANH